MDSNDFIDFIRNSEIKFNSYEIEKLNYFIQSVKEIESIQEELKENYTGPPYLKKFMLPDDYIRILEELRNFRIVKFYRCIAEKERYLKKLELPEDEYSKILNKYEKETARKFKLNIYRGRENKIQIK